MKKFFMGLITVVMVLMLSSCSFAGTLYSLMNTLTYKEISLDYTLKEEDLEEFKGLLAECEKTALESTDFWEINNAIRAVTEKMEYFQTQKAVAYLKYSLDLADVDVLAEYMAAEVLVASASSEYLTMVKNISEGTPKKEDLFVSFSKDDLNILGADEEIVAAIQIINSAIQVLFEALPKDENWSDAVNLLYTGFVESNQLLAEEYDCANYYELVSKYVYQRDYSAEQRASFRAYVAEYLVPLYAQMKEKSTAAYEALTTAQKKHYEELALDSAKDSKLISSYIDSFGYSLEYKMSQMFERKNAMTFAEEKTAFQGAFTGYLPTYDQPYVYFGPNYQDTLTVVHELGHYAAYYYFDADYLAGDLAEVHSQGNEWLFMAYLEEQVNEAVYEALYLSRAVEGLSNVIHSTLVDHFEELVYTATTPIEADGYEALMTFVCEQYAGIEKVFEGDGMHSPFEYAQNVVISHPGYYMNYATSELASMGIYVIAQEKGYVQAQRTYSLLQEGIDPYAGFITAITEVNLLSPFEEQTYIDLTKVFVGE